MKWVFLAIFIILLLCLLFCFSKLSIWIRYVHENGNDQLTIQLVGIFGLFRYKINVPVIKVEKDSPSVIAKMKTEKGTVGNRRQTEKEKYTPEDFILAIQDIKKLLHHVVDLYSQIIRRFLKKITVTQLQWESTIGTGNAAQTGIAAGALWAAKGSLIGLVTHYMHVPEIPIIIVIPHFQQAVAQTFFTCMIQFRAGHAILAGIRIIKHWRGGMPDFQSKALSKFNPIKEKSS